ncbi:MAG: hypothetical protein IKM43_00415 [Clostridia bacterium]|nr:hypothetical protein [Clostridia bacterium]
MKKWLCLLLCMFLLPSAFLLSACKNKSGYQLKDLNNDYIGICTGGLFKYTQNKIIIDYSDYSSLNTVINQEPYSNIGKYNEMFENMMLFANSYVDDCSNDTKEIDKGTRELIKDQLKELKDQFSVVQQRAEELDKIVEMHDDFNAICMNRLAKLLESYNPLFVKAYNFSHTLSTIYFAGVQVPNVAGVSVANFSPLNGTVDFRLDARLKHQVVNTTRYYVELYVESEGIASSLTRKSGDNYNQLQNFANYQSKINTLKNRRYDETNLGVISLNDSLEQEYLNLFVQACGMQRALNNDIAKYNVAIGAVNYSELIVDDMTDFEKQYKTMIDNFGYIIEEYNNVLDNLLDKMGA